MATTRPREEKTLPLNARAQRYGLLSFTMLLMASLFCVLIFIYFAHNFESVFGASYLQTGTLRQVDQLNQAMERYGEYPNLEEQDPIREKMDEVARQIDTLVARERQDGQEFGVLAVAVQRSFQSYQERVEKLFSIPAETLSQEFYVQYYEVLEIGGYIDAYLKELTQQTIEDGYVDYQSVGAYMTMLPLMAGLLFLVISVMLVVRMDRWVSVQIVEPVLTLANAAQGLAARQMDIPDIPVQREDEIGQLTRTFNRMKEDCRNLLDTQREKEELTRVLYDEQLKRSDAENRLSAARFSMLKQQINPHFLFNTLTLISQTALQEGAHQTNTLIQRLSALLRHNLYHQAEWVTVRQELEVLYNYMFIQESRFADRVVFWVDCQVQPEQYDIPSFLLQPLVENAVSHGVAPKAEGGAIRIRVKEGKGRLLITVTDSGVGMDKATLRRLRGGEEGEAPRHSGIGVANVAARMAILCPDSRFQVYSRPGLGTCVKLDLPRIPAGSGKAPGKEPK